MVRRTLLVLLAAAASASPATAGDIGVSLGARPGTLHAKAARVQLGSLVDVPVSVVDARGNGAGWVLRLAGGATITRVVARCAARSTCTLPRGRVSGDTLVAGANTGMGAMELTVTVSGGRGLASVSVR